MNWVCINGEVLPAEEARVSVFDTGFMQGIGLFETMRAYHGRVFRLDEHIDRLRDSANRLSWTVIPEADTLIDHVDKVTAAAGLQDAAVRLTVTTGSLQHNASHEPVLTIVATVNPGIKYPPELYASGVTALVSKYRQNPLDPTAGHKTTSYFARLAALREAHQRQAFEALWLTTENYLAEGSISNVLLWLNEELVTPPLDTPVLPGIARADVLDLAGQLGITTAERKLTIDDLLDADEVLLTNSLAEVVPVVRLEREPIGSERPGPVFEELREAYQLLVDRECNYAGEDA